jgi:hypothetical protein
MRVVEPLCLGFRYSIHKNVSNSDSFLYYPDVVTHVEPASGKDAPCGSTERVGSTGWTEPMSTQNARPLEGNDARDDAQNDESDSQTTPIDEHPLGNAIARNAPYAANHGDSL